MKEVVERDWSLVKDKLDDWGRHIYEQKWTTDEIRNFIENQLNNLPADHVLMKLSNGKADLFDTFGLVLGTYS